MNPNASLLSTIWHSEHQNWCLVLTLPLSCKCPAELKDWPENKTTVTMIQLKSCTQSTLEELKSYLVHFQATIFLSCPVLICFVVVVVVFFHPLVQHQNLPIYAFSRFIMTVKGIQKSINIQRFISSCFSIPGSKM